MDKNKKNKNNTNKDVFRGLDWNQSLGLDQSGK